ncbi:8335_t:CDS:2, partial [Gigaspora margarita]
MIITLNHLFLYYLQFTKFNFLYTKFISKFKNLPIIGCKKYKLKGYNKVPDEVIRETQTIFGLKYISYNQFSNIEYIAKGGFSKVYKATWKKKEIQVVLKDIEGPENNNRFFLNELMVYNQCGKGFSNSHFQKIYGITRHSKTQKYMVVMKFALHGDLHNYLLKNINNLSWNERLNILHHIIWNLEKLHEKDIIHCDLHSGNILINRDDPDIN